MELRQRRTGCWPLTKDFDITLGEVGLLSGTFFFAGSADRQPGRRGLARRIRVLSGIWACCVLSIDRQLIFAVGDSFAVLAAGRVIAGLAFGLAAVFVPAYARVMGGVKMVGLFGAGLTLGVAASPVTRQRAPGRGRRLAGRLRDHRRPRFDLAAAAAQ